MKQALYGSPCVAITRAGLESYESTSLAREQVRELARTLGWTSGPSGAFGAVVAPGDRVAVKPNWVLHENQAGSDFDPLVTHGTITGAVIAELLASEASSIVLGDAPIQACKFPVLLANLAYDRRVASLIGDDRRFHGPIDFRRTISDVADGVRTAHEDVRSIDQYVLFDLGENSYVEPVTDADARLRVTMYPPALLQRTHAPGRHQYLVAREIIDANVVVNLPKLKTHKKAGVTCALKNLVGINGNKEFLPHHRKGSSSAGGDCYPEASTTKALLEQVLDVQNASGPIAQRPLAFVSRVLDGIARRQGDRVGVEGAWSGNDTVWRMCLDLNRILMYGGIDGQINDRPQRRVLTIVDAIVAGQGDGPLAPEALPLGLLYAGDSAAAVDWFSAAVLGYAPDRIPIVRGAFEPSPWPLVDFSPAAIRVTSPDSSLPVAEFLRRNGLPREVKYPAGWEDATDRHVRDARLAVSE